MNISTHYFSSYYIQHSYQIYLTPHPRPETETLTTHLATLLLSSSSPPRPLRILDLCTGTGCIPLHLYSLLTPHIPTPRLLGIDISPIAIRLAKQTLSHNITTTRLPPTAQAQISFVQGDIFANSDAEAWRQAEWDVLISNPPYISPTSFDATTARSVRNYEPKSALVPPLSTSSAKSREAAADIGDTFYPRLLEIAEQVSARVLLVEVGDLQQAIRVVEMVVEKGKSVWAGCEIWRDWPVGGGDGEVVEVQGGEVRVRGEGNGRAVLAWRGEEGGRMVGKK